MRLLDAARAFDKTLCADAYAPYTTFYGQQDLYDDAKRDGVTVDRRILSCAPAVSIPSRRVISMAGDYWLIGDHQDDYFRGNCIRKKYVIHKALGAAKILTPVQALSSGGTDTYAARVWVKDLKELDAESALHSFVNVFLPSTESVSRKQLVQLGGRLYFVRNTFDSVAGFLVAECDELEANALESNGAYVAPTYVPSTDTQTFGTPTTAKALRLRYQDNYTLQSQSAPKFEPGDMRVLVLASVITAPKAGDKFTLSDGAWMVMSVLAENSCFNLHLRKLPG